VLPVPDVEARPDGYEMDAASRDAFRVFVNDSRALFAKHNIGIAELDKPADMFVELHATDTLGVKMYLQENSGIDGLNNSAYPTLRIGPLTPSDARVLRSRIEAELPVDSVRVVRE